MFAQKVWACLHLPSRLASKKTHPKKYTEPIHAGMATPVFNGTHIDVAVYYVLLTSLESRCSSRGLRLHMDAATASDATFIPPAGMQPASHPKMEQSALLCITALP